MIDWFPVLLGFMLLSAIWMVVTMIRIQEYLRARGRRVNPLLLRIMIFSYVNEYRRITVEQYGRPGILYRHMVASGLLTLGLAIAAVLMRSGS
jgi:hypothetical protein